MNNTVKQVFKSILLTTLVAAALGGAVMLLTQTILGFISGFIFGCLIQILGFYFWNTHLINQHNIAEMEYTASIMSSNAMQSTLLNCAFCQKPNVVNIVLNDNNEFICKSCNGKNIVLMEFSTARKTDLQPSQDAAIFAPNQLTESK